MSIKSQEKKRSGFTLTELAIVLGVIGAIVSAIWWAASNANEMQKENDAFNELQTVAQNILSLKQGQAFGVCPTALMNTDITSCMIQAHAIPTSYINTTTNTLANNPWNPGSTAQINTGFVVWNFAATPRSFRLSDYNVSRQGCVSLITQATACQAGQSGCPTQVLTNGGNVFINLNANPKGGWLTLATSTAISNLCAANSYAGGQNSVEFDYSL